MGCIPANLDWEKAAELARAHCSGVEIAAYFGVSYPTLSRRCMGDNNISWTEFVQTNKDAGKAALREAQYKKALKGNTMLLIWLGKQNLDQFDKTAINMTTKHEHIDLSTLSIPELKILRDNSDLSILEVKEAAQRREEPKVIEHVPST